MHSVLSKMRFLSSPDDKDCTALLSACGRGRTVCTSLPLCAWFVTCPKLLLKGSEEEARAAVYLLLCQSKYSVPAYEIGKDALQGLQEKLYLLPWSFSCAASLSEQIAFTYLLEPMCVE